MELSKLHINEADFDFFLDLEDREKIRFICDAQFIHKDIPYTKKLGNHDDKPKREPNPIINELFQDTYFEELLKGKDRLSMIIINNHIHLNSTSIKWIRDVVHKLFDDGHVMVRIKNAKKIPELDQYRFYRCYHILGNMGPISPN
tara:strand:+ start:63 stop:497 length:435 start_codon:yes stop_codon:yes gene_type:complete